MPSSLLLDGECQHKEGKTRRDKLKKDRDYAIGEVWPGAQAVVIGLVDVIGTLDEVADHDCGYEALSCGPIHSPLPVFMAEFALVVMKSTGPSKHVATTDSVARGALDLWEDSS